MTSYIWKRILLLIPTILIVSLVTFIFMRLLPGDAVDYIIAQYSTSGGEVSREYVEHMLGLDIPAWQQYLNWIAGLLRGDLGNSLMETRTVGAMIAQRLPVTLELGIVSILIGNLLALPIGMICAARQDRFADYSLRSLAMLFISAPNFWVATIVIIYPVIWWGWAPRIEYVSFFKDPLANLAMILPPAIVNGLAQCGHSSKMVRTMTLEVLRKDYIRTAWSKGLSERSVLMTHGLRNAFIPVITQIGGSVSTIIGGAVIMENIFNIPGMGQLLIFSLSKRDYPVVSGCILVISLLVMVVNLIVDISYKWIDPRVEIG